MPQPTGEVTTEPMFGSPRHSVGGGHWIESGRFQLFSAAVIVLNVITMVLEANDPSNKTILLVVDQLMLCFYIFELISRSYLFRFQLLFGPRHVVAWNMLDVIVVAAGIFDQWLIPLMGDGVARIQPLRWTLQGLRMLRVLRVLKVFRIFLEADLSWTEEPLFQSVIGAVILFNSVLMGVETDVVWRGWFYIEQVLLAIYVFELAVRLKAQGVRRFLSCHNADFVWNWLDVCIVGSAVLDTWVMPLLGVLTKQLGGPPTSPNKGGGASMMKLMRLLRLMRILRLVKVVRSVRPLYNLVMGMCASFQGVFWVLVLSITVIYALGIVATRLVGHGMLFTDNNMPDFVSAPFQTVPESMFTLFRYMSSLPSSEEAAAVDELMQRLPQMRLFFAIFMVASSWTLLSFVTAVVSDSLITTTARQEAELKLACAEEDRAEHAHELMELFQSIDVDGNGEISADELDTFLQDKDNAIDCARKCRVSIREVRSVLATLLMQSDYVTIKGFVDGLLDMSQGVTEKSIMRLEARLEKSIEDRTHSVTTLHAAVESLRREVAGFASCEPVLKPEMPCSDGCCRPVQTSEVLDWLAQESPKEAFEVLSKSLLAGCAALEVLQQSIRPSIPPHPVQSSPDALQTHGTQPMEVPQQSIPPHPVLLTPVEDTQCTGPVHPTSKSPGQVMSVQGTGANEAANRLHNILESQDAVLHPTQRNNVSLEMSSGLRQHKPEQHVSSSPGTRETGTASPFANAVSVQEAAPPMMINLSSKDRPSLEGDGVPHLGQNLLQQQHAALRGIMAEADRRCGIMDEVVGDLTARGSCDDGSDADEALFLAVCKKDATCELTQSPSSKPRPEHGLSVATASSSMPSNSTSAASNQRSVAGTGEVSDASPRSLNGSHSNAWPAQTSN
jgi:voltage-gated sodium channel